MKMIKYKKIPYGKLRMRLLDSGEMVEEKCEGFVFGLGHLERAYVKIAYLRQIKFSKGLKSPLNDNGIKIKTKLNFDEYGCPIIEFKAHGKNFGTSVTGFTSMEHAIEQIYKMLNVK